jgi:hypothetical protein
VAFQSVIPTRYLQDSLFQRIVKILNEQKGLFIKAEESECNIVMLCKPLWLAIDARMGPEYGRALLSKS